ncbi:MAG: VOC family protein [Cyanobacteria bacterium J06621_11]
MKLGYVLVYVEDVKATMAFYTAAFGFEPKMVYEEDGAVDYGELKTGETVLGFAAHSLGEMNLQGNYQKSTLSERPFGMELALVDEDVKASYEKAVGAGAIAVAPPTEKPWGQTVAYVRGIEGTLIEICSPITSS